MEAVVRALALRCGDPGLKTCSDHSLNLILVVPGSTSQLHLQIANWFASGQLRFLTVVVVVFCCFVDSLALKSPYGERSIFFYLFIYFNEKNPVAIFRQGTNLSQNRRAALCCQRCSKTKYEPTILVLKETAENGE